MIKILLKKCGKRNKKAYSSEVAKIGKTAFIAYSLKRNLPMISCNSTKQPNNPE